MRALKQLHGELNLYLNKNLKEWMQQAQNKSTVVKIPIYSYLYDYITFTIIVIELTTP